MMGFAGCPAGKAGARACAILAKPYSGTVVAAALTAVGLILLTAGFVFGRDWAQTWRTIGFPGVALPPFYDLYAITSTAAQCAASGEVYPYAHCGFDTGKFNYPPVW